MKSEAEKADEERYKYQCLVRHIIKMRMITRDGAYKWLNGHTDDRGKRHKGWNEMHPESRLDADVREQWSLGNRGEYGNWKLSEVKNET